MRTSFVAVGGSGGQLGLQRETSDGSSVAKRRSSFSGEDESHNKAAEVKGTVAEELAARRKSSMIVEPIPEMAIETPAGEPNKQLGGNTNAETKQTSKAAPVGKVEKNKTNATKSTAGQSNGVSKATGAKLPDKDTKASPRPAPISTAMSSASPKISPKDAPKTPTTPRKSPVKDSKTPDKKPIAKPRRESTIAAKPISKTEGKPAPAAKKSPPHTGFHKPPRRPPTVPVQLPSSLTAHTASSGSKTSTTGPPPRQSLSRASGNIQASNPLQAQTAQARSPSRVSQTNHTTSKPLGRSQSTLHKSNPRPSFGPPPTKKQHPPRQSLPQSSVPADEGFLARMMRPTTSSASKTAEKPPLTPPKKTQAMKRPISKDGPPNMQDLGKGHTAPKPTKASQPDKTATTNKPLAASTLTSQPVKKTQLEPKPSQQIAPATKEDEVSTPNEPAADENAVEEAQTAVAPKHSDDTLEPEPESVPESSPASKEPQPDTIHSGSEKDVKATASPVPPVTQEGKSTPSPVPLALPSPIQKSVISPESPKQMDLPSPEAKKPELPHESSTDLERVQSMADTVSEERKSVPETVTEDIETEAVGKEDAPTSHEAAPETSEEKAEDGKSPGSKTDISEDPEDAKAKAEIAALNAALLGDEGMEEGEAAEAKVAT